MITTEDSYALPYFFEEDGRNIRNWRCVDLNPHSLYFFINYVCTDEGVRVGMQKIVESANDLIQICNDIQVCPTMKLTQVALLTPSWLNKTKRSDLVDIAEIRNVEFDDDHPQVTVFVTNDGTELIDSSGSLDLQKARSSKTIFVTHP
jgi:hypothetical protein